MKIAAIFLVLAVLVSGLAAQGGPKPKTPTTFGADWFDPNPQGTIYFARFWFRWSAQGPAPDSAITRVWAETAFTVCNTATTVAPIGTHRFGALRTRDSFTMNKPVSPETSRTVWLTVNGKRGAAVSDTSPPACIKTTYRLPSLPPPVIDSAKSDTVLVALDIRPSFPITALLPGQWVDVCILAQLPSGRVGYRGTRTPLCDAAAGGLQQPPPTIAGQTTIDKACYEFVFELVQPDAGWLGPPPVATPASQCGGAQRVSNPMVAGMFPGVRWGSWPGANGL